MNDYKFCFIICANKENYLKECIWYIERLSLPAGYEKETIVIRNAVSMTSGYNQAMKQSDAKYKVYLHQDVLLVNPNLLSDLLQMYKDPSVGMVGVVGKQDFMASAEYSKNWDVGAAEICNVAKSYMINWMPEGNDEFIDVTAVDGMFMATQYDLPWDEETFDGWDFYDISQSIHFAQSGYRIVVPRITKEEKSWLFHDAGQCRYDSWEKYRKLFCDKYTSCGYEHTTSDWEKKSAAYEDIRDRILIAFGKGDFVKVCELLNEVKGETMDSQLSYIFLFIKVSEKEESIEQPDIQRLSRFIDEYDEMKFMLRRIYFGWREEGWNALWEKLRSGQVSMRMLWVAMEACVSAPSQLWWNVRDLYQEGIRTLILKGEILRVKSLLDCVGDDYLGKQSCVLKSLVQVFCREVEKNVTPAVFDVFPNPDEAVEHFIRLKLYLRRIEFGLPFVHQREAYNYLIQTGVSDYMILHILSVNILFKEDFCRNMAVLFAREEGETSMRARLYFQLSESERRGQ